MPENLFVVLMGVGTVFFGLICIILLCTAMSAAISAAIAEDMGTDPAGIRILSVKKL